MLCEKNRILFIVHALKRKKLYFVYCSEKRLTEVVMIMTAHLGIMMVLSRMLEACLQWKSMGIAYYKTHNTCTITLIPTKPST
jgi:hypothetical protein